MARPVKWRKIDSMPAVSRFVPSLESGRDGPVPEEGENVLKIEELEAIRLKDLEGLEQEECAARMEISRPTFQRILNAAREKVADSLILGKSIRIDGGHFTQNLCTIVCPSCGRTWTEPFESMGLQPHGHIPCPGCGSAAPTCRPAGGAQGCPRGRCRFRGGREADSHSAD
ncbi:MAG: DUF134 domain-containing protein [Clostridia bacterium]|nr:DUF134 domain-containing protein [Clostridia bacterium]